MALTPDEKVRIRSHLGFTNVSAVSTFALGTPAALETTFIIERAMELILPAAEGLVREILATLDTILRLKIDGLELLQVNRVDEIEISEKNQSKLDREYLFWCGRLCDAFGIVDNPFSKAFNAMGGINVSVSHG